jgi:curli biogenesis system outer membrane secretion channel CsgG
MMRKLVLSTVALAAMISAVPAEAQKQTAPSSGRKDQAQGMAEIPVCTHKIGTLAIVEPENQWWRELNLGSPEAILRVFVQKSGCFTMVNRGRSLQSRAMEKALAEQGELQAGAQVAKKGQVKAAQFFLEPNIVSSNQNSGGGNVGGALGGAIGGLFGGAGRVIGGLAGGINVKKGEANVTLSLVNAATTEESVVEGYFRKRDLSWAGGGGAGWWGGFAAAGASGYQNTEIGQIIVLAYLDAYKKLVVELGGMPAVTAAAAPKQ